MAVAVHQLVEHGVIECIVDSCDCVIDGFIGLALQGRVIHLVEEIVQVIEGVARDRAGRFTGLVHDLCNVTVQFAEQIVEINVLLGDGGAERGNRHCDEPIHQFDSVHPCISFVGR